MLAALLTVLAACAATTSSTPLSAVSHAEATGRFALTQQGERWVLHSPDGSPTFLLALNHLANPFYFDVIEGAAGLGPCHPYDAQCLEHDLLGTRCLAMGRKVIFMPPSSFVYSICSCWGGITSSQCLMSKYINDLTAHSYALQVPRQLVRRDRGICPELQRMGL
jgi:hypothetical protein